ncbi:menaquinone biosynthesis decarboxylase, partial [bacterium]|nr:menaquinone biosynthesis decarboxylase [bacterium]
MAYKDLKEFVDVLEKNNELVHITNEIDQDLEISAAADYASKNNGPAFLFENVKNTDIPVLINAFGSYKRMNLALEIDSPQALSERIGELFIDTPPAGLLDKLKALGKLKELTDYFPKLVSDGPCQEVVTEDVDLYKLPVIKCWPKDGGRFFTLPLVFTKDPETNSSNCGIYRMQIYDEKTTGMHWHIHKHGALHFKKSSKKNEPLEVAVAVGSDPAVTFSGAVPLPEGIDEMAFAGFIRKKAVKMVKCKTIDLCVPANAEFVLEGYVQHGEYRLEGPFGDHTGFYSLPDMYPVFHVKCLTHRKKPIYHATVVGRPPMEDCYMGAVIGKIFLPVIKKQFPEIVDMNMPFEGVFHNLLLVSIMKHYPGHARKIMHGIWSLGQAMFTKVIVVVDEDVDVHDLSEVTWKVLNNIDPDRDIEFVMGPLDALDHASRLPHYGSKMGIDGTKKWKTEGFMRDWPD